nr:hypothetical protein [Tanacetum cinerariifolium]
MIADMDVDADVVLKETENVVDDAKDGQDADDQENDEELEPAELQEVVDIVTTAKIIIEVVTAASTTITTADVLIPAATTDAALTLTAAPSRRTKGVVIRDREEKPQTEAQARKNIMVYLKNVAGFKMDYFKGMYYDNIRPIFEKHFDLNVAFLQKTKEQIDEEESKALKGINETPAEKAAKSYGVDAAMEFKEKYAKCLMLLVKDLVLPSQDDAVD